MIKEYFLDRARLESIDALIAIEVQKMREKLYDIFSAASSSDRTVTVEVVFKVE